MTFPLYAIVLRLAALKPGAVPADHRSYARGALLDLIREGDPRLAAELHDHNSAKSYTVALLESATHGRNGALHFGEGHEAYWRFTLMGEPAFDALIRRYLLNHHAPHVRFGAVSFAITDAFVSGGGHPGCGYATLADLQTKWLDSPDPLPATVTLNFTSPTAFNLGQQPDGSYRFHALPTPRHVFSALRKRWARLGGSAPGDDFDAWVEQMVLIDALDIRTETVRLKGGRQVNGFTGPVTYQIADLSEWAGFVHLLADLSFWTGVGYQTTIGMGQVRRVAQKGTAQ